MESGRSDSARNGHSAADRRDRCGFSRPCRTGGTGRFGHCRPLLHYHLHAGRRFRRRRADFDRPVKRARTLSPDCAGFLSGDGSDAGVCRRGDRRFLSADAVGAAASDQFAAGACGRAGLSAFPRVGVRLCLCRHRFPRFLRRHRQYPDFKLECGDHADRQCCRQLPADLRQFRFSGNGDRRRRAGVGDCRSGFRRRFRRLYPVQSQCFPLRA